MRISTISVTVFSAMLLVMTSKPTSAAAQQIRQQPSTQQQQQQFLPRQQFAQLQQQAVPPKPPRITHLVEFDMAIGRQRIGRILMGLYGDIVPITVRNFFDLARRPARQGYLGTAFHRVIDGFVIQGGDWTMGNGVGGQSIYGRPFQDENFVVKHTGPGLLSMANTGPDSNTSQFSITLAKTEWLDGKHVVFGRVIWGMEVVRAIGKTPVVGESSPAQKVVIIGSKGAQL